MSKLFYIFCRPQVSIWRLGLMTLVSPFLSTGAVAGFFDGPGTVDMGNGIHWNSLLGWFYVDEPYAYSYTAGEWLWLHGESERETYSFWCYGDGHWGWSVSDLYPAYNEYRSGNIGNFSRWPSGMVRVGGGSLPGKSTLGELNVSTFYIGRYEVTWGEWKAVRNWAALNGYDIGDAGEGCEDDHPVHSVSWNDALKWCNAKSEMEGLIPAYKIEGEVYRSTPPPPPPPGGRSAQATWNSTANGYRLPVEKEWEFAARGGNQSNDYTYAGSNDLDLAGWFTENSNSSICNISFGRGTWPVGQKAANELGLYDISGNVSERYWEAKSFIGRGGSWNASENSCSLADRQSGGVVRPDPENTIGFRLVRNTADNSMDKFIELSGNFAFEAVIVGQSAARTLTIHNTGNNSITVSGITFPDGFSGNWVGTIDAGSEIQVMVTFTPTAELNYTGILSVSSNATSGINTIALLGTGIAPITEVEMILVNGGNLPALSSLGALNVETFYIGQYEVTWREWQEVRTWAVSHGYDIDDIGNGCADDHPVYSVNWYDVLKWCNARSEIEGLTPVYMISDAVYRSGETIPVQNLNATGYRLPLEAEWEYAARGGVGSNSFTYSGSNDLGEVGWFFDNSGSAECDIYSGYGSWPVGQKSPNELELYDMSGNIAEWCWNNDGSSRRVRGGSWPLNANSSLVSSRGSDNPASRYLNFGFRLARTP